MIKKENIIKAVVAFLLVAIFMFLSGLVLGQSNKIMGMLIVLSVLMLLGKDLTGNPYRNITKLSVLGIGSVVCSYIANLNIFLGLVVNLIWVFVIVYLNVFNLKIPMYISFLLTYLMLLTFGTSSVQIIPRSIALIFSAFLVVGIQLLVRKKKLKKNKRPNFQKCLEVLDDELDAIINNKDIEKLEDDFRDSIKVWNMNLLERRQNNFYFTAAENRQSIIMANLEKLHKDILSVKKLYDDDKSYRIVFVSLRLVINEIKKAMAGNATVSDISAKLVEYGENVDDKINVYSVYSLSETIKLLLDIIENENFEAEDVKILKKKPTLLQFIKYTMNRESLRFTFAVRMSVLMAVCYFVIEAMHLEYGKWILFTLMIVVQPYDSTTEKSGIDRIKGTILGAIVVFVTFALIQSYPIRAGIIAIGFYMFISAKDSILKGIGTTMFALGIAEMGIKAGPHAMIITVDRVMYTAIGIIVAILGSKLILNYNVNRETMNLIDKYYKIIDANVKNVLETKDIKDAAVSIRSSMILTKSIESKIIINNSIIKNSVVEEYLEHSRNVMINIYESIRRINTFEDKNEIEVARAKIRHSYEKFDTRFEDIIIESINHDFEVNDNSALYISFAEIVNELTLTKKAKDSIAL